MNKNKEVMLKLWVACGLYGLTLGFNSMVHDNNNYNEDKFKVVKKIDITKANKTPKLVNLDGYSVFMKKVNLAKEEQIIKQKKLLAEKEKLQKIVVAQSKAIVYNPYDLSIPSNVTYQKLHKVLGDTTMKGLEEAFILAEKEYGVNALFLVGLVANESGWNTSPRATNGSNNLTGHAVYTSLSRGTQFDSKTQCILKTAKLIKEDYLKTNGEHYNGESIWNVNKKYSATKRWAKDINSIAYDLMDKIKTNK